MNDLFPVFCTDFMCALILNILYHFPQTGRKLFQILFGKLRRVDQMDPVILDIVHCSVTSQLRAKMHLKSPSVMAFLLVCLGILAYLCQNTSRDNGY